MSPSRERAMKRALDRVRAREDLAARREADPVLFAHRYPAAADKELVALVAASCAFGNVKAIRAKLEDLFTRLGPSPSAASDDEAFVFARVDGWVHRVYRGEDVARLLLGARKVQRRHGTLGDRFAGDLAAAGGDVREALARLCDAVREAGRFEEASSRRRRGLSHLLPDPRGASASKRLFLFLRWMVRPADGIDLGLWRHVDPAVLVVPVDTHIHKLATNLGICTKKGASFRAAEEITGALRRLDPSDPVKYDFSLCHMGMLQHCPSRRDPRRCEGCGVKAVCRHWTPRPA
jgi:uncharacterized protein (TIGR02757 family)